MKETPLEEALFRVRQHVLTGCELMGIPRRMHCPIVDYVAEGAEVGGFLTALFGNDLAQTFKRADAENINKLHAYALLIGNVLPVDCNGSYERVETWKRGKGVRGRIQERA